MRTTHVTPLAPCPHGERTDRTTTLDDDEPRAPALEPTPDTAAILLGDLFGRDNRIEAMLQRWTEREPEGMLF
jgi:hypothetical protein